jgi:hypothetical protein
LERNTTEGRKGEAVCHAHNPPVVSVLLYIRGRALQELKITTHRTLSQIATVGLKLQTK